MGDTGKETTIKTEPDIALHYYLKAVFKIFNRINVYDSPGNTRI